jgi:hypothetical protein
VSTGGSTSWSSSKKKGDVSAGESDLKALLMGSEVGARAVKAAKAFVPA